MTESEVKATHTKKKKSKKRLKADLDCSTIEKHANTEGEMQELDAELDMSGPTMAEKLASLELLSGSDAKNASEKEALPSTNIPSVDSVHILLKQAIHAQDYALLVNCLSTTDEKVITKSTALLNPSDILKFLKSLLSMIELRGTVLVRALPWLRSLLCQHASSIASQESSLLILNSLYQASKGIEAGEQDLRRFFREITASGAGISGRGQRDIGDSAAELIESRASTYQSALQLSTCLDCLFAEPPEADENASPVVIYEDRDSDEEEESDNTMDIDEENEGIGAVIQNSDGSDVVSD